MKLRTKLTVFSILLLAAAIALCCAIIISFAYQGEVESITSAGIFDLKTYTENSFGARPIAYPTVP